MTKWKMKQWFKRIRRILQFWIPGSVVEALEENRFQRRKILRFVKSARIVDKIIREFKGSGLKMRSSIGYTIHTLYGSLLMVNDLDDIRDVLPVLRSIRRRGYKIKKYEDYAELHRRTYYCEGDIVVSAFLKYEDGTICKFVEVRKEEKPVYELQCEGKTIEDEQKSLIESK